MTKLLSKSMNDNLLFFLKLNKIREEDVKSIELNGFRDIIIVKTRFKTLRIDYLSLKELGDMAHD